MSGVVIRRGEKRGKGSEGSGERLGGDGDARVSFTNQMIGDD